MANWKLGLAGFALSTLGISALAAPTAQAAVVIIHAGPDVWTRGRYVHARRGHEWAPGRWERHENHYDWHNGEWRPHRCSGRGSDPGCSAFAIAF